MEVIKTDILPNCHVIAKVDQPNTLNLKALCIFAATGFFMDDDTYWKNEVCLRPAHKHQLDEHGILKSSKPWFEWHYSPNELTFEQTLEAYIALLTQITKEQLGDNPVILPLSGGLDSRSQAMVLKDFDNPVHAYSYRFLNGYPEHHIAKKIADVCGFSFEAFQIPKGYLWHCIDDLAHINKCYSEFTHPRQMAVLPQLKQMKGVFSLGHWGDVLFDKGAPEGSTHVEILPLLLKKMLKPGGLEFANALWKAWGLDGDFKSYFIGRIEIALSKINIENVSAKIRAFKTTQWAHRWTTNNLSVFEAANPITLPYYDNRMSQFICTVPEAFLANRRLQIAHLKQDKALSNITWQAQRPYSINNFDYNKTPYNLPYRVMNKLQRSLQAATGKPYIQRNFELQFLGVENDKALSMHLFDDMLSDFIPQEVTHTFYNLFKEKDVVYYSHPVSMLLTFALWQKHFNNKLKH
ncbi:asparagine synthase-related protein [Hanstruepera ponticola]|uniref:asparagine synthase-related protein n=1 Tax=Hanstruepera ponticola TaxID=2042995 RepID=UPI001E63F39F|nr:asparagine synthase-related protein [Hanstruepera ponticola]